MATLSRNEDLFPWARQMIRMLARASTVTRQLGLSKTEAGKLWREIHGRSSPSGQTPSDQLWFLKTPERRFDAAFLLLAYHRSLARLPAEKSFAHAYYYYARMTAGGWKDATDADGAFRTKEEDYTIPYSRGDYLVRSYTDSKALDGSRLCPLILKACKLCDTKFLSHIDETGNRCPICEKGR